MATKVDFRPLAKDVVAALGGPENIASFTHCATRLRFVVNDKTRADLDLAKKIPGVITAINSGGQHQIVIGNDVPQAYEAVAELNGMGGKSVRAGVVDDTDTRKGGEKKSLLDRFIDLVSALITPLIWPLAGIALGKAALALAVTLGWNAENTTYQIFSAIFDSLFYFLPVFLAVTAARKFRCNEFVAMASAAALVHPTIVGLVDVDSVTFFGIPVAMMSYASSVIPIIFTIWLQSYLERWLTKVLPSSIRSFVTPLVTVMIMVPLTLLTVGPATVTLANWISTGVGFVFDHAPWVAGAILGALWQVFVIFGLHWGFVPIMLNDLANQGFTFFTAPLMAAVFGQSGAVLAVALRTRNAQRKKVAGPAALSAFLAGVTEPAVYGINLPLRLPFYIGVGAGAVGGAIIGAGRNAFDAFVFPSLLAFPAGLNHGSFLALVIGSVVAAVLAFIGTFVLLPRLERQEETPESTKTTEIVSPCGGKLVSLSSVEDPIISSGALGKGVGIDPVSGEILAPVTGTVISVAKSKHAYGLKTDDGVEVLVHVGIDTVKMNGEGFAAKVERGQSVKKGQVLGHADLEAIKAAGYAATTFVLITNAKKLSSVEPIDGISEVKAQDRVIAVQV